ncbi:MAG: hypothetical protein RMJ87_03105 [Cytophagales bacterium]|nr:hypothetical protein [Bernardetiaceae bacterium]MDW8203995.1 hypothetical protein [Cytophagales bacterium]
MKWLLIVLFLLLSAHVGFARRAMPADISQSDLTVPLPCLQLEKCNTHQTYIINPAEDRKTMIEKVLSALGALFYWVARAIVRRNTKNTKPLVRKQC